MTPLLVVAIPAVLLLIGIVLNGLHIVHDQPHYSLETDPTHKLAAERMANFRFFHSQRARMLQRQKRIGQYGWMTLGAFLASSWFLYSGTVKATAESKQITGIRTFAGAGTSDTVLLVSLSDGSRVRYLIKGAEPRYARTAAAEGSYTDTTETRNGTNLGTATNLGESSVPVGIALTMN